MRTNIVSALLLAAVAVGAEAQRLPPRLSQAAAPVHQEPADTEFHEGAMALGGVLGVVGGTTVGAVLGVVVHKSLSGPCDYENFGCLEGGAIGFLIGEPAGVAAGVHWANHSRGNYVIELATNAAILVGGLLLGSRLNNSSSGDAAGTMLLIGVPVAQIAASIAIEKATTRHE